MTLAEPIMHLGIHFIFLVHVLVIFGVFRSLREHERRTLETQLVLQVHLGVKGMGMTYGRYADVQHHELYI